MAAISTPPRSQRNPNAFKRIYASSPSSETPNNKPKTKKTKEVEPEGENAEKISLKDVYDLVKQLKSDIDTKYNTIATKVEALETQISTVELKLTVKLKQETEKANKSIEEELNTSFQMLEEGLKQKMSLIDKTNEAHNNLEQYTRNKTFWSERIR